MSIRSRMLLAYVGVWACILTASAAGVYFYMARQVEAQFDRGLESCVNIISRSLSHEVQERSVRADGEKEFAYLLRTQHSLSFPQQAVAVYEGNRLVASKAADSQFALLQGYAPAQHGSVRLEKQTIAGTPSRTASMSVNLAGLVYTVVAAEPEESIFSTLVSLRRALMMLVIAAVLLSIAGGYVLARRVLKPVVDMADAVDQLHSRNLGQTIGILNPGDELGYLGATFNRLLARLNASFEKERQFVADASHELRTPLSVCLLTAQVALDRTRSGEEYRTSLITIRGQLERLTKLVRDLLLLARSDANRFPVQKRSTDVAALVLEAIAAVSVIAKQKQIRLEAGEWLEAEAEADPVLFQQLIIILLDNAIKYSPAGSTVHVNLQTVAAQIELDVRDEGCGIPKEAQSRIFERFYRVDSSRSRTVVEGVGLGLPIARSIAEAHGGSIELAESSPRGSTFRVSIPAHSATVSRAALYQHSASND